LEDAMPGSSKFDQRLMQVRVVITALALLTIGAVIAYHQLG
jgi:hypothetical protein